MATGIFGTMRVAGETVAVAVVGAVLAAFVAGALPTAGNRVDGRARARRRERLLRRGGPHGAAPPGAGLRRRLGTAFRLTMLIAGGITFAAAVVTFVALVPRPARRRRRGRRMLEIEA